MSERNEDRETHRVGQGEAERGAKRHRRRCSSRFIPPFLLPPKKKKKKMPSLSFSAVLALQNR